MQRQESAHPQQQIEPRKRQEQLRAAHQQLVHPTAVEACQGTPPQPERKREKGGEQAGEQRNLPPVKDARQHITAKAIAAPEEEHPWRCDAEEPASTEKIDRVS